MLRSRRNFDNESLAPRHTILLMEANIKSHYFQYTLARPRKACVHLGHWFTNRHPASTGCASELHLGLLYSLGPLTTPTDSGRAGCLRLGGVAAETAGADAVAVGVGEGVCGSRFLEAEDGGEFGFERWGCGDR